MKKKHDKTQKKVNKLIKFAEGLVGEDVFRVGDSNLVVKSGLKSAKMEDFLG